MQWTPAKRKSTFDKKIKPTSGKLALLKKWLFDFAHGTNYIWMIGDCSYLFLCFLSDFWLSISGQVSQWLISFTQDPNPNSMPKSATLIIILRYLIIAYFSNKMQNTESIHKRRVNIPTNVYFCDSILNYESAQSTSI